MAGKSHSLQFLLEIASLHAFRSLIRLLPLAWATLPGAMLAWFAFSVLRINRDTALRNLEIVFGDALTPAQRLVLAKRAYRYFGEMICEVLAMPRLMKPPHAMRVVLENPEILQEALAENKGAILVSGHLGNWELMGGKLSQSGQVLSMYVGAQSNPVTDRILNGIRQAMGTETVGKGLAMRGMLRALRANRIVAMLVDQHFSKRRHFVEFFGQPVSMVPGPATIALRVGAPVIFGACIRERANSYRVTFQRIAPPQPSGDAEWDLLELSQSISDALARTVRKYPEQYFWMHRRFRPIRTGNVSETNKKFLAGKLERPLASFEKTAREAPERPG